MSPRCDGVIQTRKDCYVDVDGATTKIVPEMINRETVCLGSRPAPPAGENTKDQHKTQGSGKRGGTVPHALSSLLLLVVTVDDNDRLSRLFKAWPK